MDRGALGLDNGARSRSRGEVVELGLNYTKEDCRFELRQPASPGVAAEFLAGWAKVLQSTQHAQMQNENTYDWPWPNQRPWPIKRVWDMPVVFWLKIQKNGWSYQL